VAVVVDPVMAAVVAAAEDVGPGADGAVVAVDAVDEGAAVGEAVADPGALRTTTGPEATG
jgi:hypothetical protein